MIEQPQVKQSRGLSLIISVLVVLICLAGTGAFIWWYVGSGSQSDIIVLKEPSTPAPTINPQMRSLTPANPMPVRQGPNGQRRNRPFRVIGAVTITRGGWQVRGGQYLLNISPATQPSEPVRMELRLNGYGAAAMPMPPSFAIVRRTAHEDVMARQLSIQPDQMKAIVDMADNPAVRGTYAVLFPVLPVSNQDLQLLQKDWTDYRQAHQQGGTAERTLESDVLLVGGRSQQVVRAIYASLDERISIILTPQQISLYNALITGRIHTIGLVTPTTPTIRPTTQQATRP